MDVKLYVLLQVSQIRYPAYSMHKKSGVDVGDSSPRIDYTTFHIDRPPAVCRSMLMVLKVV